MAPPLNLHGHSLGRDNHLLPPQTRTLGARTPIRTALWHRLLASGPGVSGVRDGELCEDCDEVFETAGACAEWLEDAGG